MDKLKLNKEQLLVIKHRGGPLLIIAGAGTGKTTVITERIKYLIFGKLAKPDEILALTFTEKAAREMETRVDEAMPYGYTQMWISTFHSFCDRILRREALHIGLDPKYKLMTEAGTVQLIRENLFKFDLDYFRPLGNPNKFVLGMLQHFSRLQDEDINPSQYLDWVKRLNAKKVNDKLEIKKWKELAGAYKTYEEIKIKEGFFDYGDLITKTLKLFRERKNILREYQKQFKYLLVDEFQDTNFAQNELVKLLAGKDKNITVVGDDDQCLPSTTLIATPKGKIPIKNIKVGDGVMTAVGKGYLSVSYVAFVKKTKKSARFLTFTTKSGKQLKITDNHQMFAMVPGRKFGNHVFYVYLMFRKGLGWRIGITDDLCTRLKLERSADKIVAVKACDTLEDARFFETTLSMRYQIPTYPFKPRKRMLFITEEWLTRLFSVFDTQENAGKLTNDLGINLNFHHYALGGVTRGSKERVKVLLNMCYRKYRIKSAGSKILISPKVLHQVRTETSSRSIISSLKENGIETRKAKKGRMVNKVFGDFEKANKFAKRLLDITHGILEVKFSVGKRNLYARSSLMMPASNVLKGMYIPVKKENQVVYEQVIDRSEKTSTEWVYDLEVERTHNYLADDVVVHNSIYRFRGSSVSNIIQFRRSFRKTKIVVLTKNYRSTQEILDRSYDLIQHNNPDRLEVLEKIDKKLTAVNSPPSREASRGDPVVFIHVDRVENEADRVAKKINELVKEEDCQFCDFAILVRANSHADPFIRALSRHGIPHQFLGPGRLFKQPEVVDLISYLKVLYDFEDSVSLFRLLSIDFFDIPARDLIVISNYARKNNLSLFESAEKIGDTKVRKIIKLINKHLKLIKNETAGQLLYYFLEETKLLNRLLSPDTSEAGKKALNISKFFDKLKSYEVDHENATVPAVVDWINLSSELGESPLAADSDWTEINAVNILTVHSAKGLEFPVVFLVNLVGQRFPTMERREQIPIPEDLIKEVLPVGDYHLEEERRLFYVGTTRAREKLFVTAANYYGEGKREKKLSPFIFELLGRGALDKSSFAKAMEDKQLSFMDFKSEPLAISHKQSAVRIDYLSYSQIETFRICPLHYKLRYIYKIPTPPSAALSFGVSMHSALKDFYESIKRGIKPSKDLIITSLTDNWLREGFTAKSHEEKMLKKGKNYLTDYFKYQFDPKMIPVMLEQSFVVPLGPPSREASEGHRPLRVGGKIDRVDLLPDGRIEIIDYKTGANVPTQKEIDRDLQMTFYALAATSIPTSPFGKKPEEIVLTFYYFDNQKGISTVRTRQDLEKAKEEIIKFRDEIQKSDFECSGGILCKTCEYKLLCNSD